MSQPRLKRQNTTPECPGRLQGGLGYETFCRIPREVLTLTLAK